jgi:hypothetical protein
MQARSLPELVRMADRLGVLATTSQAISTELVAPAELRHLNLFLAADLLGQP